MCVLEPGISGGIGVGAGVASAGAWLLTLPDEPRLSILCLELSVAEQGMSIPPDLLHMSLRPRPRRNILVLEHSET